MTTKEFYPKGSIGHQINLRVPERFHCLFYGSLFLPDWFLMSIDTEAGMEVVDLLSDAMQMIDKMPDASSLQLEEKIWQAVAEQCLTWVYG